MGREREGENEEMGGGVAGGRGSACTPILQPTFMLMVSGMDRQREGGGGGVDRGRKGGR